MSRLVFIWVLMMTSICVGQQSLIRGTIIDERGSQFPGVKVKNERNGQIVLTDTEGIFSINADKNDIIIFSYNGCDTLRVKVNSEMTSSVYLFKYNCKVNEIEEVNIVRQRMKGFDVGFLPAVKGVQITTGTNSVIELAQLSGAKSTGNPREIFAKVPGLNIWESDGAGIQIGIGGRGLSPDRAANFNTRQNGCDISADALGYPESYYTPPMEALRSIEIIRGSASLQFGTQFGGLLNFVIRDPAADTPLEITSRNTVGTYGYLGTFNRVTGTKGRLSYQVYHQYKRGNGYRQNSQFKQHQAFAQIVYHLTERQKIRLEYTHMNYLAQQPGGLSDVQYENDIRQSYRNRNWFAVDWNMLAAHYDLEVGKKGLFNVRAFGMVSTRKSIGFLEKITMADHGGLRTMIAGDFKNYGAEARYLQKYNISAASKIKGATLIGGRVYRGSTIAQQGNAPGGDQADFRYLNPDDLENSSYSFPSGNVALFLENIFFIGDKWRLNTGFRYEYIISQAEGYYKQYVVHPVNFDTIAVYRNESFREVERNVPLFGAGISRKFGDVGLVYGNWTQNYRAINFTDIRVTNPNIIIDSLIKDEYGFTSELGFRGMWKDVVIYDLALFYLFYGDKIGLAPKQGTIYKERTNIGDARNVGIELFVEVDVLKLIKDSTSFSLSWFVNTAYTDTRYIRSKENSYLNKRVEYVSPFMLKSGLKLKRKDWLVQIQGAYNSAQFTDATNSIVPSGDAVIGLIPAYLVFDVSGRYKINRNWSFEMGINNFTNQKYFTRRAISYPGPGIIPSDGINGYLTIQYKFSMKHNKPKTKL